MELFNTVYGMEKIAQRIFVGADNGAVYYSKFTVINNKIGVTIVCALCLKILTNRDARIDIVGQIVCEECEK